MIWLTGGSQWWQQTGLPVTQKDFFQYIPSRQIRPYHSRVNDGLTGNANRLRSTVTLIKSYLIRQRACYAHFQILKKRTLTEQEKKPAFLPVMPGKPRTFLIPVYNWR